ncbi:MAG TPA: DUF2934 domain-containing protein [Steroidobacteraceae bacterium]
MANRRIPDSQRPTHPALPAAAPLDAKPATPPPVAAVKKATKKPRAAARHKQAVISATVAATVSADERRGMIAKAAYLRGERRGFAPGGEADDWMAAEQEIDALLSGGSGAPQ